ncbi:MAG: hypothetical protein KGR26_01190 [Cyanobacteria bacterium REEB65]|nr:hypothetical protein [Cyanobacteria bacterium REEB65]
MEEAIIAFLLEAVPVRIAQLHLGPRVELLIALAIPAVLVAIGAWARQKQTRPRAWRASVNQHGKLEWTEGPFYITPAALPHAAGPSTGSLTETPATAVNPVDPVLVRSCRRCGSHNVELVGGYCLDCHLAGEDAGFVLIAGLWIPRGPSAVQRQAIRSPR